MKLLILSDIHGNWPALEAVLEAEPDPDVVAFCGDVVDYGPFPVECVRWLAGNANYLVRGNHDNALAFDQDCHCMGSFREASLTTRAWHHTLLAETDREFLRGLPTLAWFEFEGRHFRMSHATPQGDVFEYLPEGDWSERVQDLDSDFVLLGHTHHQGMRVLGKTTVVNPGSVGWARDGGGQACYAIYQGGSLELKRVPYDVAQTVEALRKAPLPKPVIEGLVNVLNTGSQSGEPDS